MKLSIIVPVYNTEKYLEKCLDSLVNQTMDDYEVILVNDGSKDSSQSIIDSYVNQYPALIRTVTVENGGQGRARNIGIDMARGEYLGFVDSDDWVDSSMYSLMYGAAVESGAGLVICDMVSVYPDGREEYRANSRFEEPMSIPTGPCDKLFRRDAVGDIRFPEGLWYEDADFVIKTVLGCRSIARVGEGLYFYRCGQLSTMNNKNARKNLDMISIMEDLKAYMLPRGYLAEFEELLLCHLLLDTINRVNVQRGEGCEEVIKTLRDYARENIPDLSACHGYKKQSLKRRIVMSLNYHGLHSISRKLFKK